MHILAHTTIPLHKEAVWRPLQVRKGKATVFWEVDFLKFVLALEPKKKKKYIHVGAVLSILDRRK